MFRQSVEVKHLAQGPCSALQLKTSMSARNRTPPLLEPYIRLPREASLLLLTGVLNATSYWLLTRYLGDILGHDAPASRMRLEPDEEAVARDGSSNGKTAIVLVSWMRDFEFWRTEARRGGGLDLARLASENRFAFVDGLTQLFGESTASSKSSAPTAASHLPGLSTRTGPGPSLAPPRQSGPLPPRGQPARRNPPAQASAPSATATPSPAQTTTTHSTLTDPSLVQATTSITAAITALQSTNTHVVLVLDAPTLLLATGATTAIALSSLVLSLRSQVHSTLLVLEADTPLVQAAAPAAAHGAEARATPLEAEHAAFVVGQAHAARWVLGTRALDTGVARDVSGVLRVVKGGGWDEEEEEEEEIGRDATAEMEVLYLVQADGGVKVFERGAGDVG